MGRTEGTTAEEVMTCCIHDVDVGKLSFFIDARDRENSTVFVADLPHDATEEELRALFKDVRHLLNPSSQMLIRFSVWFDPRNQTDVFAQCTGCHSRIREPSEFLSSYTDRFAILINHL